MYEPEDITVTTDTTLRGITAGAVEVLDGATVVIDGAHAGSVELSPGTRLIVKGQFAGSVDVQDGATVLVQGALTGSAVVHEGGSIVVESQGSLAGSAVNWGTIRNSGKRAGPVEGDGHLIDEPGSTVVQPTINPDGSHSYKV